MEELLRGERCGMSRLVIKIKRTLRDSDREGIENTIKKDLDENGFVLLDDNFEVYDLDKKETK
jgi:hypothetical protein